MSCVSSQGLWSDKLTLQAPVWVTPTNDGRESSRTYELSNLDQIYHFYSHAILFFGPSDKLGTELHGTERVAHLLEDALRELLLHCPWAAGRLRENQAERRMEVECSGGGVLFLVAHAGLKLADLGDLWQPHPSFDMLLPRLSLAEKDQDNPLVALQVTRFECGAFAVGMSSHHALMDGTGAGVFLQNLCSIARGDSLTTAIDNTSRRELMKPRVLSSSPPPRPTWLATKADPGRQSALAQQSYGVPKAYRFQKEALERLKEDALDGNALGLTICSRYQALVALLWKAKAKSFLGLRPQEHELTMSIPINVREKVVPYLKRGYLGNAICFMAPTATLRDLQENPLFFALQKIVDAMSRISVECLQAQTDVLESIGGMGAHLPLLALEAPSLAGLPFYQVDCGYGRPICIQRPSKQRCNVLIILEGPRCERGSLHALVVCSSEVERLAFEETINLYTID